MLKWLPIPVTALAMVALWLGYENLNVLRRTVFWEFRYVLLGVAAFLGLSLLEWLVGWLNRPREKE